MFYTHERAAVYAAPFCTAIAMADMGGSALLKLIVMRVGDFARARHRISKRSVIGPLNTLYVGLIAQREVYHWILNIQEAQEDA